MLGTVLRTARARGAPLLDADLEWSWPAACADDCWIHIDVLTACADAQRRGAAARLQACLRRRLLEQGAQRREEQEDFAFLVLKEGGGEDVEDVEEGEWEVLA
jgi:hypothetical protein